MANQYQIRVKGQLDSRWSDWFENLTITPQANGDTLIVGPVTDQPALYSLLKRIRDLGLPLLLVERLD
jgi:hypothetical protein